MLVMIGCLMAGHIGFAQTLSHPPLSPEDALFLRLEKLSTAEGQALQDSLRAEGAVQMAEMVAFYRQAQQLDENRLAAVVDSLFEVEAPPALFHILRKRLLYLSREEPVALSSDSSDSMVLSTDTSSSPPAKSGFGFSSVEFRPYQDNLDIELRVLGEFFPRFYFYAWNRTRINYDWKASNFNIVDLYFNFYKGFFLVQETQVTDLDGAVPRYGMQYFHRFNPQLSFIVLATANFNDYQNLEFLSQVRYFPPLTPKLDGMVYLETLTITTRDGHLGSGERLKLGLRKKGFQWGGAIDVEQIGNRPEWFTAPSLFLLRTF